MKNLAVKEYLSLTMPREDQPVSDHRRLQLALEVLGYGAVEFPLHILRQLYPMCREAGFDVTVTLVSRDDRWVVTAVEPGDTRGSLYGLAVDYGSTTIVMELVDLRSGAVIGREQAVNGQVAFGTDILTRITHTMAAPQNREELRLATAQTFRQLLDALTESTGIPAALCPVMTVSGNTTMIHFLLGLDAWTVFAAPYAPVTQEPGWFWGRELDMDFSGLVYMIPAASNYIGGDIISGLLTLDLPNRENPAMFFDIGTNGELVIGSKHWLLAGAGAAGPALEGYISRNGMRAAPGAIEKVRIEGNELKAQTIGGMPAVGICGSGIMDLLAQMRLHGWMNVAGELQPEKSSRVRYLPEEGQYAVVYAEKEESASGEVLSFTQQDIRQYLDTKAAAFTMIDSLLDSAGIGEQELEQIYLSGAFCAHGDLESAITLGFFPDVPRERYTVRRNTSLDGARQLLQDRSLLSQARFLAEKIYCVQFADIPDFLVRMQAAKFVPHTDSHRFPYVNARLKEVR